MKKFKLGIVALIFFIFSTAGVSHAEEKWKDVQLSAYSFQVPDYSKKLSRNEMKYFASIDIEGIDDSDAVTYDAWFMLKKGAKPKNITPKDITPFIASGVLKKDSLFFNLFESVLYEHEFLEDEIPVIICDNDKELLKAIESGQERTLIISKNKKAVFSMVNVQREGEKYTTLLAIYIGKSSAANLTFMVKAKELKENVPMFLKIGDTISFKN